MANVKKLIPGFLVAATLIGASYWYFLVRPASVGAGYQAVFLSNGQVYFGKLANPNSNYPVLTDVYYLVVTRPLQQAAGGEAAEEGEVVVEGEGGEEAVDLRPKYTLIKLGGELHGPTDELRINRRHILFIEDLKDDSRLVTKIKEGATSEGPIKPVLGE